MGKKIKKRSKNNVAEDKSKGEFEKILSSWIVNPLGNDYGFDYEVRFAKDIDEDSQEVLKDAFYAQLKSARKDAKKALVEDFPIADLILYSEQKLPVLICKYDCINEIFYWEIAQIYIWNTIEKEDSEWKERDYKRIKFGNKIDINDLESLKNEIDKAQIKIIEYQSRNLNIGGNIPLSKLNLSELKEKKEKKKNEIKSLSLAEAMVYGKEDMLNESKESLLDVYNSEGEDEEKLKSIIGLAYQLNLAKKDEQESKFNLINEGIILAKKIKSIDDENFLKILKAQLILFVLEKNISDAKLSIKMQGDNHPFSYFFNKEFQTMIEKYNSVIKGLLNPAIEKLRESENYLLYIHSLSILVDIVVIHIMNAAAFDTDFVKNENKSPSRIIQISETILNDLSEIMDYDLKASLLISLSNYHYWTKKNNKAVEYLERALKSAEEEKDISLIRKIKSILNRVKDKPNPYHEDNKNFDELTFDEHEKLVKSTVTMLDGIIGDDERIRSAVNIGLEDINPKEYLRFCKHLRIGYFPSPVGRSLGLVSLGSKVVWCKHAKSNISGFKLGDSVEGFKKENNCNKCEHCKSRGDKWVGTMGEAKEIERDPDFMDFLKKAKYIE